MSEYLQLSPGRFAFAFGLIGGLGVLLFGWAGWLWGYGILLIKLWSSVYIGFAPTFMGGIIGGVWAFVDFFLFAWLVAIIYNISFRASR